VNRQDIIKLAREAGLSDAHEVFHAYCELKLTEHLERFAALVAAGEREACAKVCDEQEEVFQKYYTKGLPSLCAQAIRARGQA
jgi:hypothetical protein